MNDYLLGGLVAYAMTLFWGMLMYLVALRATHGNPFGAAFISALLRSLLVGLCFFASLVLLKNSGVIA